MLDRINFGTKNSESKVNKTPNFSNGISFKAIFESFDNKLACFRKEKPSQQTNTKTTDLPSYYYPNVVKYAVPPQDTIAKPMYAVPNPEINNDEEPPVLKYAVPPMPNDKKDDEPPVLKYAIPGRF